MRPVSRRQLLQRLAVIAGPLGGAASVASAERSMCGNAPPPAYPALDKPALVQSWLRDGRQDGAAPDCNGLRSRDIELLVRVTARFHSPLDGAAMLGRLGAVSALKGMPYWSYTDKMRQLLVSESYAVDHPVSMKARADFSPAELRSGALLFFVQSNNRAAALTPYSLQLLSHGPDRLLLRVENAADLRYLGMKVVAAHEMQWVLALEPLANGHWGYRSLLGICHLGMGRAEQHRLSNLARSVALFDHLAGRQTDIETYR
jgi:hypothetical protein